MRGAHPTPTHTPGVQHGGASPARLGPGGRGRDKCFSPSILISSSPPYSLATCSSAPRGNLLLSSLSNHWLNFCLINWFVV